MATFALLITSALTGQINQEPQSAEEVEREIRILAESLSTVRFVSEEFALDKDGEPIEPAFQRLEYSSAPGDRRRVRSTSPYEGREMLGVWYFEDGKMHHSVNPLPDDVTRIESIHSSNQVDTDAHYSGMMNGALWLFMPRGRPLHILLDEGAEVRFDNMEHFSGWVLEAPVGEHRLQIELDSDHDWLPRRIRFGETNNYECTRFYKSNGRWFPVEGWSQSKSPGGVEVRGFRLVSLSLNHPIDESEFATPNLEEGVLLSRVDGMGVVGQYVGGSEARDQFELRTGLARPDVSPEVNAVGSRSDPVVWSLIIAGVVLIVLGLTLYRFRTRSANTG